MRCLGWFYDRPVASLLATLVIFVPILLLGIWLLKAIG